MSDGKKRLGRILIVGFAVLLFAACNKKNVPRVDYAEEMRSFVKEISVAAKSVDPDFVIIPQNGARLATISREQGGLVDAEYLAAIDGQGQEDLFYGYDRDNKATPYSVNAKLTYFLDLMEDNGVEVLATDYCSSGDKIIDSYKRNEEKGYVSFAADQRNLNNIPDYNVVLHDENTNDIEELSQVENFLYLINPTEKFHSKSSFLGDVKNTNYDLLIIDRDFNDEVYTNAEIESLKRKKNGGKRLVICYMSIGEAEDYRSYWKKEWKKNKTSPDWLYKENKKWRGNYKVFYWMPEWKTYIYGSPESYLTSILNLGFDGTYLDIIDAYEYYEDL